MATLTGSMSPLFSGETFEGELLGLRNLGEGLMAAFCGVTGVAAAAGPGTVMGVVMMVWLVPGISWIWPA